MRRIIALATAVLLVGVASAQTPLSFDDSRVDYTNTDLETAYLALVRENGTLKVILDDVSSAAALPGIVFNVPDRGRTDFFGKTIGAVIGDVEDVAINKSGNAFTGYTVTHEAVSIRNMVAAYTDVLESQGFGVAARESTNSNLATLVVSDANGEFLVHLHQLGSDVTAYLASN